ncbi:M48 family metallopeptidase [Streptomyces sp. NPDC020403]|uniref:M48 family metallopeptidase n=1 Tax=unclassified Streptomyces TaxID=2593676 RepID=UPI0034117EA1
MQVVTEEESRPCPECGTEIRTDRRFTTWCAACDWNVDPEGDEERHVQGRLGRARRVAARRHGERLHAEVGGDDHAPTARTLPALCAYALACAVHGVTLALVVGGVWCVVYGWGGLGMPFGLFLLFLAWTLRPRLPRLPTEGPVLRRGDAPALYGLVDDIARVAGTRGVDVIAIDTGVNASVTTCGVRERRLLTIGLPLWELLTPQQRIALLGHELGHYSSGDTRRGIVLATAYRSLTAWRYFLAPAEDPSPTEMAVALVCFVPRALVQGVLTVLDGLTLHAGRRAEYLADSSAARAGSTEAAVGLLDRILVADSAEVTLRREANAPRSARRGTGRPEERAERLWDALAADAGSIPEHEYERRRRAGALRGHRVDSTHPPTHLRRERLLSATPVPAAVVVDEERERRITGELADARSRLARQILRDGFAG